MSEGEICKKCDLSGYYCDWNHCPMNLGVDEEQDEEDEEDDDSEDYVEESDLCLGDGP